MKNQTKKLSPGFTIIEVSIVLVIVAAIMMMVFLAVPALRRNSNNSQRRADVGKILTVVSEYSANQNGALPAVACWASPTLSIAGGTCASPTGIVTATLTGKFTSFSVVAQGSEASPTTTLLQLVTGAKCNGNTITNIGAGGKDFVAWFQVEPAVDQCQSG